LRKRIRATKLNETTTDSETTMDVETKKEQIEEKTEDSSVN